MRNLFSQSAVALHTGKFALATLAAIALMAVPAFAEVVDYEHATIDIEVKSCVPTVFSASEAVLDNQYLVVDTEDAAEQFVNIPQDSTPATINVGPFTTDTTVSWHIFGGGERDYDEPLWNGYGGPTFGSDIGDYAADVGGFGWVIAGTDDPNPFVNWNEIVVPGCLPETKADCKKGGYEAYGFKNQGQCIRFVNTGKDSR